MSTSRFTLWWDRSLRFAMGSGSIFSGSLFGIIRNKWLATHLHAAGLGVLAQTTSAQAWLGSLANMGVGFPVAHAVGAARGLGNDDDARRTIWTALSITSLGSLLGVGAAALVLTLVDLGTMLAVRSNYLSVNGVAANGLLQAALALSQQVGTLFYAYLSNYAFGKVSGLGGAAEIRVYTRRHWRPLMLLAAPIFALAMVAS